MSYAHFTLEDREMLQYLKETSLNNQEIALSIAKSPSSIGRELTRNKWGKGYIAGRADAFSQTRRTENKPRPKRDNIELMKLVEEKILKFDWSPEQISGRFKVDYPENPWYQISYNTIYSHLLSLTKTRRKLFQQHLRQGKRTHRKRRGKPELRGAIPDRIAIDLRPQIVDQKTEVGHWEGDTIEGAGKKGYVGTFVERMSQFLIAFPMANKQSKLMASKASSAFVRLPSELRLTCTVDNGKEFTAHKDITAKTSLKIYFAHPYSSFERGLNENTNGLLRQYLPKKKPLTGLSHRKLDRIVELLNNRPRKTLGYRTPAEVFATLRVALQI